MHGFTEIPTSDPRLHTYAFRPPGSASLYPMTIKAELDDSHQKKLMKTTSE
jgi:hypothetical protein